MLLLTTAALPQLCQHWRPNLGRLITPRHYPRLEETAFSGIPWAADNDCFQGLDTDAYTAMVDRIATGDPGCRTALPGCLFVTVPDVVCDAAATLERFEFWQPILGGDEPLRLPLALVLQNGQEHLPVPWDRLAAVFIGGDTEWKLGQAAAELAGEARARGKHVHGGRVNSAKRVRYMASIGCQSIDGSGFSKWRDTRLPAGLTWAAEPPQLRLVA